MKGAGTTEALNGYDKEEAIEKYIVDNFDSIIEGRPTGNMNLGNGYIATILFDDKAFADEYANLKFKGTFNVSFFAMPRKRNANGLMIQAQTIHRSNSVDVRSPTQRPQIPHNGAFTMNILNGMI